MIDPRTLTDQEIGQLMDQGCTCTDWSNVTVSPQFDAATVSQTALSGKIELGHFDKVVRIWPGVVHAAGIFNATLHNCRVGNHTLIRNVGSCLSNLDIADEVIIDQVNLIATTEETSFGNGVEVAAVNEAGGREVPIYDRLSAQTAYLIAFYRHRPQLIANLKAMIASYAAQVQSERGTIGRGARLVNCDTLINCRIGPDANLEQVTRLENGTVNSRSDAPTTVGPGVIARDFIMTDGALVTGRHCPWITVLWGQGSSSETIQCRTLPVLCQLRGLSGRGLCGVCRTLYRDPPQVQPVDRGLYLLHERW